VSGSLERFLIERGERVLRIPTHLTAKGRKSARQRGKSDPIDAINVARAALQEGLASFPVAHLDGPELDLPRFRGVSLLLSSWLCATGGCAQFFRAPARVPARARPSGSPAAWSASNSAGERIPSVECSRVGL
jgi:hypothetical protein